MEKSLAAELKKQIDKWKEQLSNKQGKQEQQTCSAMCEMKNKNTVCERAEREATRELPKEINKKGRTTTTAAGCHRQSILAQVVPPR